VSAFLVALYTIRFTSAPSFFALTDESIQAFVIMLIIGTGMSAPMALIRRREQRLRRAVETRAVELEARNAELRQANSALEAFGYVVSHDLKEPVRAIENYLDSARDGYGTLEGKSDLDKAADANARLVRLLQGLLSYSRASSMTPTLRPLSVEAVVRGEAARAQYETLLNERRGELTIEPGIPQVMADEVILSQLFGNVILNAIRHTLDKPPRIAITRAPANEGEVHVVIEDNGPGFPPDVLARFRELRGARPATLRAGFGLVISHRAAQRLGATMELRNSESGARVHLRLPAAPVDEEPRAGAEDVAPAKRRAGSATGGA
jgi:signal transduction histidine kinase